MSCAHAPTPPPWRHGLCSELPRPLTLDFDNGCNFVRERTGDADYQEQLGAWLRHAEGDLQALRGVEQPTWTREPSHSRGCMPRC